MFGNTLVLPRSDGNVTAIKINQDGYSSEYLAKSATSEHRIRIRHTKTKATADRPAYDRHNVEVVETVYETAEAPEHYKKCYVVIEQMPNDTAFIVPDALADWLIASAGANLTSLLNWES